MSGVNFRNYWALDLKVNFDVMIDRNQIGSSSVMKRVLHVVSNDSHYADPTKPTGLSLPEQV